MYVGPGDSGGIGPGDKTPAEVNVPAAAIVGSDSQLGQVALPGKQVLRALPPVAPPGEFRQVEHGW